MIKHSASSVVFDTLCTVSEAGMFGTASIHILSNRSSSSSSSREMSFDLTFVDSDSNRDLAWDGSTSDDDTSDVVIKSMATEKSDNGKKYKTAPFMTSTYDTSAC